MSSFVTDKEKGNLAEASMTRAIIQMGGGIMFRPYNTDEGEHTDIIAVQLGQDVPELVRERVEKDGEMQTDKDIHTVWMRCIDVKHAANAPSLEVVEKGKGNFLIEWKSGAGNRCTPLSNDNALTTHIALVRVNDKTPQAPHPFYLLCMDDVREFYLKYNNGSGKYIKPVKGYPHAVLIDCAKFAEEYGFLYVQYDEGARSWRFEKFGQWNERLYCIPANADIERSFQELIARQRRLLSEGTLSIDQILMDADATMKCFYGCLSNPKQAMKQDIRDIVQTYDPKYAFVQPERGRN